MSQKAVLLMAMSLVLPWVDDFIQAPIYRVEEDSDSEYTSVCTNGELTLSERGVNKLPIGFSGNYPSTGIFEVGNLAGDENGKKCPLFDFGLSKADNVNVTVSFASDPYYFPSNTVTKMLGYEVGIVTSDGESKNKRITQEVDKLGEIFTTEDGDYRQGGRNQDSFTTNFYLYHPANTIGLSITMQPGDKLSYVRFIYGDVPQSIVNASLFLEKADFKTCCLSKPTTPDCTTYDYTKELGTHVTYNMISPYGSYYSQDYLLSCFLVKDYSAGKTYHPTLINDPDQYFQTAATATIGTTYQVQIIATDASLRQSDITFNFTVGDLTGPSIQPITKGDISVSYSELNKDEFIKNNFYVIDNLDGECKAWITDEEGNLFDNKQVGTFYLQLESKDSHGNLSTFPFEVTLIDDIPPVIDSELDELILTTDSIVTSDYLLSLFSCNDEIDGQCSLSIKENTYSDNSDRPGSYDFTVQAVDKAGNTLEKTIHLLVQDNSEGPVFFTKQSALTFIEGRIPEEEDIVSSLIRNGALPDKNYVSSQVISGTAIKKNLPVGDYEATMMFTADDDTSELIDLFFSVVSQEDADVSLPEKELTWWDKFIQFWQDLWKKIISFFNGSGN